ncbi:MAG: NUDIX hydrolase [Patescibacteria group bacterium]|nr:NUDIX hydrolase [Patescibacteria group bacterium]MDD5715125.1 NUDIX hydrolase [Patescibacteria group bacterium]
MTHGSWKTVSSRTVYRNQWLRVQEDKVLRPDGTKGIYGFFDLRGSSAIVAVDTDRCVYLIRQWRYPLKRFTLEIPWGGRDHDESFLAAARRELREEAGIDAKRWKCVGKVVVFPGVGTEYASLFLAQSLRVVKQKQISEDGPQEVLCMPLRKAISWCINGKIDDAVTIAALLKVKTILKV